MSGWSATPAAASASSPSEHLAGPGTTSGPVKHEEEQQQQVSEPPVYFVCSRCEYPVCGAEDLILTPVPGGTTSYAFSYSLEYLLDLDDGVSVPCYCGDETVDTALLVSESMLSQPLPPSSVVTCMESVVASRRFLKEQQTATVAKLMHQHGKQQNDAHPVTTGSPQTHSGDGPTAPAVVDIATGQQPPVPTASRRASALPVLANTGPVAGHEHDQSLANSIPADGGRGDNAATTGPASPPPQASSSGPAAGSTPPRSSTVQPVRRYGATTEARVDLVCVRNDVLNGGLALSDRDRSGTGVPAKTGVDGSADSAASRLPQSVIDAASQPPPKTSWGPPGNLTVEESFILVTRATSSAQGQWFSGYLCEHRVECPDCHLPLGFIFTHHKSVGKARGATAHDVAGESASPQTHSGSADASADGTQIVRGFELPPGPVPVFASLAHERQRLACEEDGVAEGEGEGRGTEGRSRRSRPDGNGPATTSSSLKRSKTEDGDTGNLEREEGASSDAGAAVCDGEEEASPFGDRFIGLELKRIKQVEWTLREFQLRYAKAQNLSTFRGMFPEAEELLSLYSRLSALRTQSELYNSLLRKHKEQNDVQSSLVVSQKERLHTYEEKLKTMQQIINAQRFQLDMQATQLKQQEELMRSQRQQVHTQQQQLQVEQLLLTEQTKTIESQRQQIQLMKAHLFVKSERDRLADRHQDIADRLREHRLRDTTSDGNEEADDTLPETSGEKSNSPCPDSTLSASSSPSSFSTITTTGEGEERVPDNAAAVAAKTPPVAATSSSLGACNTDEEAKEPNGSGSGATAPAAARPHRTWEEISQERKRRSDAIAALREAQRARTAAGKAAAVTEADHVTVSKRYVPTRDSGATTATTSPPSPVGVPPMHLRGIYGTASVPSFSSPSRPATAAVGRGNGSGPRESPVLERLPKSVARSTATPTTATTTTTTTVPRPRTTTAATSAKPAPPVTKSEDGNPN